MEAILPGSPSVEMLDDWMQEGYELSEKGLDSEACDKWFAVWQVLQPRFTPHMRTADAAGEVFSGTQCLFNWTQDFCMALYNAARGSRRHAELGIRYCRQVLDQFPDEGDLFRLNFRLDMADLCFVVGNRQEGERLFEQVIEEKPDEAAGYARLSDALVLECTPPEYDRAVALLEQALARPVIDPEDWDLRSRLDRLLRRRDERDV